MYFIQYYGTIIFQGTKSKGSNPKTDVGISLGQCESEFDITIIDRIHSLMNPEPVARTRGNSGNNLFAMTVCFVLPFKMQNSQILKYNPILYFYFSRLIS